METELLEVRTCLQLVLDAVDYTAGAGKPTEMVGALLPKEIIERSRKALAATRVEPEAWQTAPPLATLIDEEEADNGS